MHARSADGAYEGSAGTIYLEDNAEASGDLIIDNGGLTSGLTTPLRTDLTTFKSLEIRNRGKLYAELAAVPSFTVMESVSVASNAQLTLESGVVMDANRLRMTHDAMRGGLEEDLGSRGGVDFGVEIAASRLSGLLHAGLATPSVGHPARPDLLGPDGRLHAGG